MTAEPTNTSIAMIGAKVVWGDVDPSNGLLDPKSVRSLITEKTKAIVMVHYAGMVCDMDEFTKDLKKEGEAIDRAEEFKTILIVDDDPTALRQMKNLLSSRYKIFVANSGMNAITILAKNQIDLILLDYEMPVVDGPKVLEMLRNDPNANSIPVMFLTAKGDKESIMNVVSLKPEKYLLKTMAPREIMDAIDEFFATHR